MDKCLVNIPDHKQLAHLLSTEIRHIEVSKLTKLSAIIDKAKAWGRLLEELTRPIIKQDEASKRPHNLNLSLDAINIIEQQFYCGKSPTLTLLNHWAITGRRRPTVWNLLGYLRICGLNWAEDYVCQAILGIESINQIIPHQSSSSQVKANLTYKIDDEFKFDDLNTLLNELNTDCTRYSFRDIYETTNHFSQQIYKRKDSSGFKIGEGRFSSVFRAQTMKDSDNRGHQQIVAAKLLRSNCNEKYLANEINLISKVKHDSILELLGIALGQSNEGCMNYICLVYPYMENGSLLDCLESGLPTENMKYLSWDKRIDIAIRVAQGITYLHSFEGKPIIHRDIKTANIFVNSMLEPKIGDFTLVRQLDTVRATETQFSQNIIGTSVYMPPEAFRGDISIKFDTFSFGIVLLELLTGLRPFNEELGEDLFTFINDKLSDIYDEITNSTEKTNLEVSENRSAFSKNSSLQDAKDKFLKELLDNKGGCWDFNSARILFDIAMRAIESRKKNRPELSSLIPMLQTARPKFAEIEH